MSQADSARFCKQKCWLFLKNLFSLNILNVIKNNRSYATVECIWKAMILVPCHVLNLYEWYTKWAITYVLPAKAQDMCKVFSLVHSKTSSTRKN